MELCLRIYSKLFFVALWLANNLQKNYYGILKRIPCPLQSAVLVKKEKKYQPNHLPQTSSTIKQISIRNARIKYSYEYIATTYEDMCKLKVCKCVFYQKHPKKSLRNYQRKQFLIADICLGMTETGFFKVNAKFSWV